MASRPLKVLQLSWSLHTGGLERVVLDLTRCLPRLGVTPLAASLEQAGAMAEAIKALGAPCFLLGKRPGLDLAVVPRLARLLGEQEIDLVHAHNQAAAFYGGLAAAMRGKPLVITRHGASFGKDLSHRWLSWVGGLLCRRMVCVGADALAVARERDRLPERKLRLIYNGVDTEIFRPDPAARREVRQELGLDDDAPLLISVGRLSPEKDCPGLVRAVAELVGRGLSPTLLFVGDGAERGRVEEAARGLGPAVRLLGMRSDIPRLLAAADVFALASLSEGISIAILEAMAAGLPVVATQVGGNPEIVAQDQGGLLAPPSDPAALAQALQGLLTDAPRRLAMGRAARELARTRFSLESTARAYADLYHEAAREGGRRA